jgi:hypothetical protein
MLWLERKTAYVIRNRTDERTPDSGLVYPRKATREPPGKRQSYAGLNRTRVPRRTSPRLSALSNDLPKAIRPAIRRLFVSNADKPSLDHPGDSLPDSDVTRYSWPYFDCETLVSTKLSCVVEVTGLSDIGGHET